MRRIYIAAVRALAGAAEAYYLVHQTCCVPPNICCAPMPMTAVPHQ
jgi:hypothetical protein